MNIITDWYYRNKETGRVFCLNRIDVKSHGIYVALLSHKKDDQGRREGSIDERIDVFAQNYEMVDFDEILQLLNK